MDERERGKGRVVGRHGQEGEHPYYVKKWYGTRLSSALTARRTLDADSLCEDLLVRS